MSDIGYTVTGLQHGIERCRHNIKVLEQAVKAERNTIKEYRIMISSIEEANVAKEAAEAGVHIEVERDGSQ